MGKYLLKNYIYTHHTHSSSQIVKIYNFVGQTRFLSTAGIDARFKLCMWNGDAVTLVFLWYGSSRYIFYVFPVISVFATIVGVSLYYRFWISKKIDIFSLAFILVDNNRSSPYRVFLVSMQCFNQIVVITHIIFTFSFHNKDTKRVRFVDLSAYWSIKSDFFKFIAQLF